MAYSVRLTGFSKADGSEQLRIEPDWWKIDKVRGVLKGSWKASNETGSYRDEEADISAAQALALHAQFASIALDRIAYNEDCVRAERLKTDKHAAIRF